MRSSNNFKIRNQNGFILAVVLFFCLTAILLLGSVFPLIDEVVRLESSGRSGAELRAASDFGIDYAVNQLNLFEEQNPGMRSPIVDAGPIAIPNSLLSQLPNGTVSIDVQSITRAKWNTLGGYKSTIYSQDLDRIPNNLNGNIYIKIVSKAKRGMLTKTIRVFLEPTYNVSAADYKFNPNTPSSSYFADPLYSVQPIVRSNMDPLNPTNPLKLLNIDLGDRANNVKVLDTKKILVTTTNTDPPIIPELSPIPAPGISKLLIPGSDGKTILESGPYTTGVIDFNAQSQILVNSTNDSPTKIFIQDSTATSTSPAPPAATIDASAFRNEYSTPALQIWYDGKRPISLNLSKDFNGLIYSPNAAVTVTGPNNFSGAIVADNITLNNTGTFSIDQTVVGGTLAGNSGLLYASTNSGPAAHGYRVVSWQEVSASP